MSQRDNVPGSIDATPTYIASGTARVGAGVLVPGFLRDFGVEPKMFLRSIGLEPDLLDRADNLIAYAKNAELYAAAARATGRDNFGVMVGLSASLHHLGSLGVEMRKCKNVHSSWKKCSDAFRLQVRGAILDYYRDGDSAYIRYIITDAGVTSGAQISSGAIAFATSVMRELCGPGWRAQLVELPLRQPTSLTPFQAAFGCPVRFNSPYAVLKFAADWVSRAPYNAHPGALIELPKPFTSVSDSVREVTAKRLVAGANVDSCAIARALAMSRRTLYRRLLEEGETFQEIIQTERMALAYRLLRDTDISITGIALIAGYSEASAFSRAFHNWFDYSPRKARGAHMAEHSDMDLDGAAKRHHPRPVFEAQRIKHGLRGPYRPPISQRPAHTQGAGITGARC